MQDSEKYIVNTFLPPLEMGALSFAIMFNLTLYIRTLYSFVKWNPRKKKIIMAPFLKFQISPTVQLTEIKMENV